MPRIARYLLLECGQAVGLSLLILTFLLMLPQVLDLVDLWVNKHAPVSVLGQLIALMIPRVLLITLPMALLLGILLAMGRMSDDSEIVILKAAGLSLVQMVRPILPLALVVALLSWWLTWMVVPESRHGFMRMKESLLTSTIVSLKPRIFNRVMPGLTIYLQERDPDGRTLRGILIHDQRRADHQVTLTARQGVLYRKPDGQGAIFLEDGSQHQVTGHLAFRQMTFASYDLDLGLTLGMGQTGSQARPEIMLPHELQAVMAGDDPKKAYVARLEWHRRLAIPVATLILGIAAIPLGVHHHRSGRGYNLILAILLLLVHMLMLTLGEGLAKREMVDPVWGLWIPNLLMAGLALHLLSSANQEKPPAFALWLDRFLTLLPQRLLRPGASPP